MPYDLSSKLKIAVTTRALFRLETEDKLYREQGRIVYEAYQIEKEKELIEWHGFVRK